MKLMQFDEFVMLLFIFAVAVFIIGSIVHYVSEEIEYYRWQKEEKRKKVK